MLLEVLPEELSEKSFPNPRALNLVLFFVSAIFRICSLSPAPHSWIGGIFSLNCMCRQQNWRLNCCGSGEDFFSFFRLLRKISRLTKLHLGIHSSDNPGRLLRSFLSDCTIPVFSFRRRGAEELVWQRNTLPDDGGKGILPLFLSPCTAFTGGGDICLLAILLLESRHPGEK